jgi:GNAT superfamily N-acetyltransferase
LTLRFAEPQAADLPALDGLFRRGFGRRLDVDRFQRKYASAYTGVVDLLEVAFDGARAVACFGLLPQMFTQADRQYLAAFASDYVTDPDYRRRGLIRALTERLRARAAARAVDFVYGLVSPETRATVERTGWRPIEGLRRHRLHVATAPLARACARFLPLRRAHASFVRRVFAPWRLPAERYRNSLAAEGWLCQRYDGAFFHYKRASPNLCVDLAGVHAWLKVDPDLMVGDLWAPDAPAFAGALARLRGLARRLGVSRIVFVVSPGTRLAGLLDAHLPGEPSWTSVYLDWRCDVPRSQLKLGLGDYDTF